MKKRTFIAIIALATTGVVAPAWAAFANPTSISLDFTSEASGTTVAGTGFQAAYNPLPDPNPSNNNALTASGFYVGPDPYGALPGENTLNIWSDGNDIYGQYEVDPDTAHNVFYSSLSTGSQTVVTANLVLQNLNNDYHGGGIWLGTDEDHYIRLGVIYNNGKANVEMLRENEDLWAPPGSTQNGGTAGHSGDGNDIADQQEVIAGSGFAPGETYLNNVSIELQLILTGSTARAQYSLNNGSTWLPVNSQVPYFAGIATSTADGATTEGGFKVGVFSFGGNSASNGAEVADFENFTAVTSTLSNVEYTGAGGDGNASNTANFSHLTDGSTATGDEGRVYEFPTLSGVTSSTTVNLDAGLAGTGKSGTLDVGGLVFSSPYGYTIAGPQTLVVNSGLIDSQKGYNVISAPMTVSGSARIDAQIHVASGSTLVLKGATVPRLDSLAVDSGGQLDLTTNSIELDYQNSAVDPFNTIEALVKSGYNKGAWNGSGIISSAAAVHNAGTSLAVIDTGVTAWGLDQMFGPHYVGSNANTTVGSTSRDVLIMYTWLGDINLDGKVDGSDLALMGTGTAGSQTWANGDFNYDNVVNADDFALFQLGDAVQNSVLTPAPEPMSAIALMAGLPLLGRRRR